MGLPDDILDSDFDMQMRGLFREAECALEQGPTDQPGEPALSLSSEPPVQPHSPESAAKPTGLSLPQLLRPVVQGLEAVSRATNENTVLLKKLEITATAKANAPADLPQIVAELRGLIEAKNGVSQSMFSALHQELKCYKDGFLLESVHRPMIRDLISLYDDITGIQRQVTATMTDPDCQKGTPLAVRMSERLRTIETHLVHNLEFIVEVLNRLEVSVMEPRGDKLDKLTQRAVTIEVAGDPEQYGEVISVVKRGFLWKDRVLRAEEVVIKKWQEGLLVAHPAPPARQPK